MNTLGHNLGIAGVTMLAFSAFTRVGLIVILAVRSPLKGYRRLWIAELAFFLFFGFQEASVAIDLYHRHFGLVAEIARLISGVAASISVLCVVSDIGRIVTMIGAGCRMEEHTERNVMEEAQLTKAVDEARASNRADRELERQQMRDNMLYMTRQTQENSEVALGKVRRYGEA